MAICGRFEIDELPEVAPVRLAVVGRARWSINGRSIGAGPVRASMARARWDDADVATVLRRGENEVTVLATFDPEATAWSPPPPGSSDLRHGAVAVELHVGGAQVVGSDATWTGMVLDGWSATPGGGISGRGTETLRTPAPAPARASAPADRARPVVVRRAHVFGASGSAGPPTHPVGPFAGRPLTRPIRGDRTLAPHGDDALATDEVVVGTLVLDVVGPPGSTVTVEVAERLDDAGRPAPDEHDAALAVTVGGPYDDSAVESVDVYGLRGLRWRSEQDAVLRTATVRERLHPVTGGHSLACSDERLDRIWQIGRRTVTACSLDAYVDCPTREQRAWTGDSVVHQMVDLATNDDWSLARWHPVLAAAPRPDGMLPMAVAGDLEVSDLSIIPDWALHWVHSVWNLFRHVDDDEALAPLVRVAAGVCEWFDPFCDDRGVPTDVPGWVIVDWASVRTDGTSTVLAGLWARALVEVAEMAEHLGDHGTARRARRRHERLAAGIERCWDPARGRYVDRLVDGAPHPAASQHAQAAVIVGGVAPPDRHARLTEVLTDADHLVHATFSVPDGPAPPGSESPLGGSYLFTGPPEPWWDVDRQVVRAQPFFRYVVHDALVAAGRADLVAEACLDWRWLLDRSPTSWGETWFSGTTCHGWSSTPTRDLITTVLGIRPAAPGFAVAAVEPALGHLDWAEGSAPTPAGPLSVRVTGERLVVDSPLPFDHAGSRHPAGHHEIDRRADQPPPSSTAP